MNELLAKLLAFVDHKDNCDFLQPMWHKGPCDCGLFALFEQIAPHPEISTWRGMLVEHSDAYKRWLSRGEHER